MLTVEMNHTEEECIMKLSTNSMSKKGEKVYKKLMKLRNNHAGSEYISRFSSEHINELEHFMSEYYSSAK